MVKINEVIPFSGICAAPNCFWMVGGDPTVRLAVLLVAPVPPLTELTGPVMLVKFPAWVPVTFTTIMQLVPGVAIPPPTRLMIDVPAVAVTVPPHVLLTPGVLATCKPACKVSEKDIADSAVVLAEGFVMVNVRVVVPFSGMLSAPKALLIVGG